MSADGPAGGRRSWFVRDGRRLLDLDRYVPYFLTSVYNVISRGASQLYLARFGVGIVEWRVATMLALEPGIPAARICEVIALDKGGVSRALARLAALGHAEAEAAGGDPRRKLWRLTASGEALHDGILELALQREAALVEGVEPDDLEAFLRVMRRMRVNVERLRG